MAPAGWFLSPIQTRLAASRLRTHPLNARDLSEPPITGRPRDAPLRRSHENYLSVMHTQQRNASEALESRRFRGGVAEMALEGHRGNTHNSLKYKIFLNAHARLCRNAQCRCNGARWEFHAGFPPISPHSAEIRISARANPRTNRQASAQSMIPKSGRRCQIKIRSRSGMTIRR